MDLLWIKTWKSLQVMLSNVNRQYCTQSENTVLTNLKWAYSSKYVIWATFMVFCVCVFFFRDWQMSFWTVVRAVWTYFKNVYLLYVFFWKITACIFWNDVRWVNNDFKFVIFGSKLFLQHSEISFILSL